MLGVFIHRSSLMDVRIGYAAWIGQYAGDDAVLVHILVAAGAIHSVVMWTI